MRLHFFLLFLALTLLISIPSRAQELVYRQGDIRIVTTTSHIADLVRQVVGDKAQVQAMMNTGTDPHLFRPTRSDLFMLKHADIIFYNGLHLEAQMSNVLKMMAKDKPVVAIADVLAVQDLIVQDKKSFDPHIWMNVNNWRHAIQPIVDTIKPLMKEGDRLAIDEAAKAYEKQLDELDYKVQVAIDTIPRQNRVLITAHDAFGYLGQAYGMQVIGVQGLSTESEAGIQHIENLIDLICENNIKAIFVETSVSPRNIEAIVEGVMARGHEVKIGGSLYSDSLGPKGSMGDNYIGMMVHNVSTIAKSLGGDDSALADYQTVYLRAQ